MEDFNYKKPLKNGNSLEVFDGEKLVFECSGKWLYPLFEAEKCLKNKKDYSFHDTAVGKAAAVLMIRLGAKQIHGNVVSLLAVDFIKQYNSKRSTEDRVELSWVNLTDRLPCATETELEDLYDIDEIYLRLRRRAKSSFENRN